ncbi:hypothetical protein CPB86DRAFT_817639 [Serendipita vermifera]|nr:hypothetical protein CPB86DRAFT_817639 [Serendipita vermifera]
MISDGTLAIPTGTGFQALFGVPHFDFDQSTTLSKTMALEVEIGCMTLGSIPIQLRVALRLPQDTFQMNETRKKYSGPDILHDVLPNWTDAIREYVSPFSDTSILTSDGIMLSINNSSAEFTEF